MKKYSWICLILALILTLGTVGCTDDTVHGDDAKQTESTDNKHEGSLTTSNLPENFVEFYHEAERAYALFTGYRSYSYTDSTFSENGADYRSVDVKGYTTLAELRTYCEQYFSSDLTDELMARTVSSEGQHPLFKEHKGKLYQFDGYAALFGYDVGSGYNMTLESFENDSYIVRIDATMTENNREIPATAYCTYTLTESGEIRFTSFELMAKKLFEALGQMPIDPEPFDAESFFAHIPAEWSQRLFWHQIHGSSDYMYFCNHRTINDSWTGFTKDPPKSFSVYHVDSKNTNIIGNIGAELPADLTYDTVCPVTAIDGAGSMECEFIIQLTDGDKVFYVSFDNFDWGENQSHLTFTYRGILTEERVNELKSLHPDSFRKAEQYFWHYTLDDFANEKNGDNIVYEGYTVEYDIPHPNYKDKTFPFHIHLPQVNADSIYVDKWNLVLKQEYEMEFGDYLQSTAYGTNATVTASVRYETVTTGDIITIYIIKNYGILNSGAHTLSYDIYHYDTVEKKFLSTDQFLAYYAEGQFADYTVAQIVKFMNENVFTTDEMGSPYPITEENILGVIPSVFGDGKFDVVYMGYNLEGYHATRTLFSPYPTYTSDAVYTYRLTYHDCLTCHDKELYGSPVGYRLLLSKRVDGQYDVGYYADRLFTEDIAERPESYPESVYGEYYTPVRQDEYGNMYMVVDHETDKGNLNTWIPFGYPETAQDYYRGVLRGYFNYERILDGNYQVNQNIASQVAEVLDAYRNGKDPNALLPDSKTEYTPYPLNTIRENPTANEIGEILKNTSMSEDGTIHFDLDLGSGWVMSLPIDIGGFGESVQAYFTGVWFAHGTPMEEEYFEWIPYTVTDKQTGYTLSFSIPETLNHNTVGVLSDENGNKRIEVFAFQTNYTFESFKDDLREIANEKLHNLDYAITGTNKANISYIGYHVSVNPIGEEGPSNYYFCLNYNDEVRFYINIYGENIDNYNTFYDEYVLPILDSVTVRIIERNNDDKLALRYKPFSGVVSFKPGDGSVWAEHSADLTIATDAYFNEYGNDEASRPPLVYYLVHKMGLSRSEMYDIYCADVLPEFVDYLFIEDTEEAKRALMTNYSFYADGKVYTFYEVYNAEMVGKPLFDITESDHAVVWWNIYDYLQRLNTYRQQSGDYIPFVEEIISEYFTTITDIADWETLGLSKEYSGIYSFLWNLVSGESEISEYNGLGIKDYSLTRLYELNSAGTTVEFKFTVTGNSLPETLPPGTYTKIVEEGIDVYIYDNKKPETRDEYEQKERIQRGLDKFGDNPAVQAVNTYLSWRASYEVSPYGEWDMTDYHLPYNYICAYYGNNLEISFSELQRLMSEKFGIAVERPQTEMVHSYSICLYDSETDTVRYADTRGITPVHRFLDVREEDGVTYVIVQLFADRNRLIPSHKVQYAIGEGEVFLGSEIIQEGNYEPRDIRLKWSR